MTQHKTQPKTTRSKTTEIVRGIPKGKIKPSSALTQNSDWKRAKSTANTQTRFDAVKIGKNLATTPQPQAHRVNLPNKTDTTKTSNVRNNSNITDGDKTVPDATVKQTPAHFVQTIHALVAPNDIYGGTNYTNRNNHNFCKYEFARPGIIKITM